MVYGPNLVISARCALSFAFSFRRLVDLLCRFRHGLWRFWWDSANGWLCPTIRCSCGSSDRELLLAFLHHFPALEVRDLVVVLPALGVRDLDGRTGGSGLDAAARSAALGVVREVLPSST